MYVCMCVSMDVYVRMQIRHYGATGGARRSCVVSRENFLVPDNSCWLVWHSFMCSLNFM